MSVLQLSKRQKGGMKRTGGRAGWVILVVVSLAVLAVFFVVWGGPVRRRVAEWMNPDATAVEEAVAAYRAGNWQRAADLMRPLLKSRTDNPEMLRLYARASARLNHDTAAAAIYAGRLGITQMEPEDLFLLGLLNSRGPAGERLGVVDGG